jgi:toxin FitB
VSYLLDTNIVSEVRKGARCDPHVSAWYASIADDDIFLSTLILGEIRKGVERARARDPDKAAAPERWLEQVIPEALDSDSFPNPVMARKGGPPS